MSVLDHASTPTPWRSAAEIPGSPAGPLFSSPYAESELTEADPLANCSLTTGSQTILCCA